MRRKGMAATVPLICTAYKLPTPVPEFKFHPTRRWKFDWAWPAVCVAIRDGQKCSGKGCVLSHPVALEVEGGAWIGGRHTSGAGFLKDMEKYNAAVLLGWKVLRCTPKDVASGAIAETLKQALA